MINKAEHGHNFEHSQECSKDYREWRNSGDVYETNEVKNSPEAIDKRNKLFSVCSYCEFIYNAQQNIYKLDPSIPAKVIVQNISHSYLNAFNLLIALGGSAKGVESNKSKKWPTEEQLRKINTITKPLLALDLDDCLVSSELGIKIKESDLIPEYQFLISTECGFSATTNLRPHLDYFFSKVSKYFDFAVFTSSIKPYADKVCDRLEEFVDIKARLYRNNCVFTHPGCIKDLSLFGEFENIFLLENDLYTGALRPDQLVYIKHWSSREDKERCDTELIKVANFLVEKAQTGLEGIEKDQRIMELANEYARIKGFERNT